jgi:hypothetical protein
MGTQVPAYHDPVATASGSDFLSRASRARSIFAIDPPDYARSHGAIVCHRIAAR